MYGSINLMIKYYVFEKKGVFVACPHAYYLINPNGDDLSMFNYMLQQGFSFYDADFHQCATPIYANTPDEAICEAKRNTEKEINKLKSQISRLKSDKEFSFKKDDAYKVFGVPDGTSWENIEPIRKKLVQYFHHDNGVVKSEYIMSIINAAWDEVK